MIKKLNDSFHTFGLWLTSGFDDNGRRNQNGRRRNLLSGSVSTGMLNHCVNSSNNNNNSIIIHHNDENHHIANDLRFVSSNVSNGGNYYGKIVSSSNNGNYGNNAICNRNAQRIVSSDDIYRISLNVVEPSSFSSSTFCEKSAKNNYTGTANHKKLSKFRRGLSFLKEKSSHNKHHSIKEDNHMKKSINLEHLDEYAATDWNNSSPPPPSNFSTNQNRDDHRHATPLDECYSLDSGVGTTSDLCSNFYKINVSREQFESTLDEINRNNIGKDSSHMTNNMNRSRDVINSQSSAPLVLTEDDNLNENSLVILTENDDVIDRRVSKERIMSTDRYQQAHQHYAPLSNDHYEVEEDSKMSRSTDDVDSSFAMNHHDKIMMTHRHDKMMNHQDTYDSSHDRESSSSSHAHHKCRLSVFRDAKDDNIRILDKNAQSKTVKASDTAKCGHVPRSKSRDLPPPDQSQDNPRKKSGGGLNFRLSSKFSKLRLQNSPGKVKNPRNSATIADSKSLWNLRADSTSRKLDGRLDEDVGMFCSKLTNQKIGPSTTTNGIAAFGGGGNFKRPARPKSEHFASCQLISAKAGGRGISTDSPTGLFGRKETYETLEKLGEGSYASVYKGQNVFDGTIVALKEIRINAEEGCPFTAIREASLLKGLKHANIVLLHDIIHTKDCLTFVFEYVHNDLSQYLERNPIGIHPSNVKLFLFQLLRGLAYCHDKKILHRDIKPQNLLISESGELKLADFGLARAKSVPSHTYSHEVVTLWYRPPDVLLGSTTYSTSLDMWGVGCIFAEMITGNALFPGAKDVFDQLDRIFRLMGTPTEETWEGVKKLPNYVPRLFTFYSYKRPLKISDKIESIPDCEPLLSSFLQMDPEKRISARSAMTHAYFADLPPQVHILPHISSIFIVPGVRLVPEYRMRSSSCYHHQHYRHHNQNINHNQEPQRSHCWQDIDC